MNVQEQRAGQSADEKNPVAKKKRKWIKPVVIIFLCLVLLVNLGGGTYLFIYAIVNKSISGMTLNLDAAVEPGGKLDPIYTDWYAAQPFEEMHITTEDGLDLVGYYLANEQPTNRLAVLPHGYMMNHTIMAAYAKYYYEDGFNIFMGDSRGHGRSEGTYVGMGWLDCLDYLQWLDALLEQNGEDTEIVMHGISMGGATVASISGEDLPEQVKAIISDCSFDTVYNEFGYQAQQMLGFISVPFLNIASLESRLLAGYSFRDGDVAAQVAKSETPIMIIHGDADTFNPVEMAYTLYDAAAEPKELWIVPGAEHGKAFDEQPDEYFVHVRDFYNQFIQPMQGGN